MRMKLSLHSDIDKTTTQPTTMAINSTDQPTTANAMKGCPFSAKHGYATTSSREEYLAQNPHLQNVPSSLEASMDVTQPLYFWQIHSITGQEPLFCICQDFYELVYQDSENLWFKQVFEQAASKQHHIMAQAAYWIDAMGGGRLYPGGSGRLNFHHHHNASMIMNARGAKQWMTYMKESLRQNLHLLDDDPRVLPAILQFLKTKMRTYANVHYWEFDDSDFEMSDILGTTNEDSAEIQRAH